MTVLREMQEGGKDADWRRAINGWVRDVRAVLNGGLSWKDQFKGGIIRFTWDPVREPTVFVRLPSLKRKPLGIYLLSVEETPRNDVGYVQSGGHIRWQGVETTPRQVGGIQITDVAGLGSGVFSVIAGIVGE